MKTVAFIPVRGGSKSIPGKNIKPLGGKPLLFFTLEAACQARGIDEVYVSSDSSEILACAKAFAHPKVRCVVRPPAFATDEASTESAMIDFADKYDFDRMVLIQATSPLTTSKDLDLALRKLEETSADSLLSGTHEFRFRWKDSGTGFVVPTNYDPAVRPRRQDWDGELVENGAFYITARDALLRTRCRLSGNIAFWPMPPHTAVEIDTPDDWSVMEALVRKLKSKGEALASKIKLLITDVDGVLTDGGMYYGAGGETLKKFNTRDGMGLAKFREAGGTVAIVTGENSPSVSQRATKLGIDELHLGVSDKLPVVQKIAEKYGVSTREIGYIGDDVNDLRAMAIVGFVACPSDAHPSVKDVAHYVCRAGGGQGCVREFVDFLLQE